MQYIQIDDYKKIKGIFCPLLPIILYVLSTHLISYFNVFCLFRGFFKRPAACYKIAYTSTHIIFIHAVKCLRILSNNYVIKYQHIILAYSSDFLHHISFNIRNAKQQYLPNDLKDRHYYVFGDNKTEQLAKSYFEQMKKMASEHK